ncbi:hypothetical protein [Prescottella agglutinans]|uniref:hypothetical protein n=1 Tax=Prescottella agglutinans TaxID=1644129 RepID=UPI000FDF3580|nr:hypothetical protein [Prescottella agglutinans]
MVRSEFAPLRTVVVSQSQFGAPEALSESSTAFLAPEDREMLATMLGRDPRTPSPNGSGVTVEYVDFAVTRSFGGAFRCTTQVLRRE